MPPLPKVGSTGTQPLLNTQKLTAPQVGSTSGLGTPTAPGAPLPPAPPRPPSPDAGPIKYADPTPDISLPKLNRRPTTRDLIIKRTFDGLSPEAARDGILKNCKTPIAAENTRFVTQVVNDRLRDMQAALNNVFTPGTPDRQFLEAQGKDATLGVLSSMSDGARVTYEVSKPNQKPLYYRKDWSGRFVQTERPAYVVMDAKIRLEPRGIAMRYPTWSHPALSGPLTTMQEI